MRISDWSSDVCSSDLEKGGSFPGTAFSVRQYEFRSGGLQHLHDLVLRSRFVDVFHRRQFPRETADRRFEALTDRKRVVSGKSVSVRVGLGGRRILPKKRHTQYRRHDK